jgi:hypothetical protein
MREPSLMNLVIFGNIVKSWSWFGVNMLRHRAAQLRFHRRGVPLADVFVASQLAFILLGLLPAKL